MITVIDYGMGNLGSILNMLRKIGADCVVAADPYTIGQARKLILPGVGAFDSGMDNLRSRGQIEAVRSAVLSSGVPILGICLGMHLMTRGSEEGESEGLGLIEATTVRFRFDRQGIAAKLKIPHMGWQSVKYRDESRLFASWQGEARFYFVHSYHVVCDSEVLISANAEYGYKFAASIERGNVFGVQFHPEKSHRHGLKLLQNFVEL